MPPKKKRSTRRTADCIVDGCDECATHLLKVFTVRVPTHCEQHAQPDDDFFKFDNRLCEVETCRKRAYFRSPDVKSTKPVRCKDHKNPDDVDNTPRCPCPLQRVPVFGPPGSKTRGFRCSTCRLDTDVDIRNTRCKLCNTNQVRTYVPGEDPTVLTICMTCAHARNYDVPNTGEKLCLGCNSVQATFGVFGGRPMFCFSCRDPAKHVDVRHDKQMCKLCWGTRGLRRGDDIYCLRCFMIKFPDAEVTRNYKTKQRDVDEFLRARFADKISMTLDRKVERVVPEAAAASAGAGGVPQEFEDERPCKSSGRKPDVLIDMGEWVVVVEVDEDQHDNQSYEMSCENKRVMQIFDDAGRRPTVFIRFNPDKYKDAEGHVVRSPWTINGKVKSRIQHVPVANRSKWDERLETLAEALDYTLTNRPLKDVSFVFLYYDKFDGFKGY
jgi:hypothetical protein